MCTDASPLGICMRLGRVCIGLCAVPVMLRRFGGVEFCDEFGSGS